MLKHLGVGSHMPFVGIGPEGPILFFCKEVSFEVWKVHYCVPDGVPVRIETGFSDDTCECSPIAYFQDGKWFMSLIAGGAVGDRLFRLWKFSGSLDNFSKEAICPASGGFVWRDNVCWSKIDGIVYSPLAGATLILPVGTKIFRVSFDKDPSVLFIAGQDHSHQPFSLRYNLITNEQKLISCDGVSAYKCCSYGEKMFYSRQNPETKRWKIVEAESISFEDTTIVSRTSFSDSLLSFQGEKSMSTKGPGAFLHDIFMSMGIRPTANCGCWENALKMDMLGIEWCEENVGEILQWIREAASERKLLHMVYTDDLARMLILRAVSLAKEAQERAKALQEKEAQEKAKALQEKEAQI